MYDDFMFWTYLIKEYLSSDMYFVPADGAVRGRSGTHNKTAWRDGQKYAR